MEGGMRELRNALGLSQKAFSEKLGISRDVIASYEVGRVEPDAAIINLICITFNVSESWLRTGSGEILAETESGILDKLAVELDMSPLEVAVWRAYFALDDSLRGLMRAFIAEVVTQANADKAFAAEVAARTPPRSYLR